MIDGVSVRDGVIVGVNVRDGVSVIDGVGVIDGVHEIAGVHEGGRVARSNGVVVATCVSVGISGAGVDVIVASGANACCWHDAARRNNAHSNPIPRQLFAM